MPLLRFATVGRKLQLSRVAASRHVAPGRRHFQRQRTLRHSVYGDGNEQRTAVNSPAVVASDSDYNDHDGRYQRRGFTGHQYETGIYFMQARFYPSTTLRAGFPFIGRFLQPDTIVPDPANPQSLNRYSYVYNNPMAYTDPTGHVGGPGAVGTGCLGGPGSSCGQQAVEIPPPPPAAQQQPGQQRASATPSPSMLTEDSCVIDVRSRPVDSAFARAVGAHHSYIVLTDRYRSTGFEEQQVQESLMVPIGVPVPFAFETPQSGGAAPSAPQQFFIDTRELIGVTRFTFPGAGQSINDPKVNVLDSFGSCVQWRARLGQIGARISAARIPYNLMGPNSNTTIRVMLEESGLAERHTDENVIGWDHPW